MRALCSLVGRGAVLVFDYGYPEDELWAPWRTTGTLLCFRRHTAHENPYIHVGDQDITAHVNFTALLAHMHEAGFRTARFESLAQTLLRAGERDQFAAVLGGASEAETMRRRMQLKTLLYGMGETFRVVVGRKER